MFVPCYSDTAKIKERIFRSGIRFEKRDEQGSKTPSETQKKRESTKEHAHLPPNSFGVSSERDEEFSSALT